MLMSKSDGGSGGFAPKLLQAEVLAGHRAKLTLAPFGRGAGAALGEALRHVLLNSLQGCAPTQVTWEQGAPEHTVPGAEDDGVANLLLSLQGVAFRMHDRRKAAVTLRADREGAVRAGDILAPAGVKVLNPEHVLTQLPAGARLDLLIQVEMGRGQLSRQRGRHPGESATRTPTFQLDVDFSPVRKVACTVQGIRTTSGAEQEQLVLDIETNGSMTPFEALDLAAHLLKEEIEQIVTHLPVTQDFPGRTESGVWGPYGGHWIVTPTMADLRLSRQTVRCLEAVGIRRLDDLVKCTEEELLRIPNLGPKGVHEIKRAMVPYGLLPGHPNAKLDHWPPGGSRRTS